MNENDGVVYSTRQLADSLGLGAAMVRKWALALEKLTGKDIPVKRRDGRRFSREHFDIIARAKALVDSNNGLSVDTALKMVLSGPENAASALVTPRTSGNTLELTEALTVAIAKGNEPLLAELQELRRELKQERRLEPSAKAEDALQESLIVSAAKRLDRLLKRVFRK
jgi:hypothetical protein